MTERTMSLQATANQTVGPYFHIGMTWLNCAEIAGAGVPGRRVTIRGRVLDGRGEPVPDALLEIWQADASGRYAPPAVAPQERRLAEQQRFLGFGRIPTDARGSFEFTTIKPGALPAGGQAPHLAVNVFMRGLLRHLVTRIYFPDDDHGGDLVLNLVEPSRRATLIARDLGGGILEWNVALQGPDETVFFDL
jgi:protocatechuate 3,4-dioxygenase alpha subunit